MDLDRQTLVSHPGVEVGVRLELLFPLWVLILSFDILWRALTSS
jgi:hypothetical protein